MFKIVPILIGLLFAFSNISFADDKILQQKAVETFHAFCYASNADFDYIERYIKPFGFKELPADLAQAMGPQKTTSETKLYLIENIGKEKVVLLGYGKPNACSVNVQGVDFTPIKKMMIEQFKLVHAITDDVGLQVNEMYVPGGSTGDKREISKYGIVMLMYPKPTFGYLGGTVAFMPPEQAIAHLGFSTMTVEDALASYVNGDFENAITIFSTLADQGDAVSCYSLGTMYLEGKGVKQSAPLALHYFQLAADRGLAIAQYNLGVMYLEGNGVARDDTKALNWHLLAANQGLPAAQSNLATMYYEGKGGPKSVVDAYAWWIVAVSNGDIMGRQNMNKAKRSLSPRQKEKARKLAKEIQSRINN